MATPAQVEANRANALKSTGPKTEAGKAVSRRNALVHGFSARVVAVPGEDPEALAGREGQWQVELNPRGTAVGAFLVGLAVRTSARLERLDTVHESRAASLARDADSARAEARAREVEALGARLKDEPDLAARRLRAIPEGCDYLAREFAALSAALAGDPPSWDRNDSVRYCQLIGLASALRFEAPSPVGLAELRIDEHRRIGEKLRLNASPDAIHWTLRYSTVDAHEADRRAFPEAEALGRAAADELRALIAAEVAALEGIKASLLDGDRLDAAEATYRARFDSSDEGKLIHRYEQDAERTLLRTIREVRDLNKTAGDCPPARPDDDPAESVAPVAPPPARNEPNRGAAFVSSRPDPMGVIAPIGSPTRRPHSIK